ncbi:MAG: DegV family protein [Clostridiales bacterium]|nr:DegV family protein [Clostridiales bacterium]
MKVKILGDSTCDLSPELLARYDIDTVPLYVTLGGKTYRDAVDIDAKTMLGMCEKSGEIAKTAADSVGDLIDFFRPYVEAGFDIVYIGIASGFSAQVQNAEIAAKEFSGARIRIVSSENLSTGIGLLLIEAAERAAAGMDCDRIADEIEALRPKVRASFVIDTLSYLHKGGRCSGLAALGAAMLKLKPQISVIEGAMRPTEKFRGQIGRVALKYADEVLADLQSIRPSRVFVTHSGGFAEGDIETLKAHIEGLGYFSEVLETNAGCVISSHCGPRTVGVLFTLK